MSGALKSKEKPTEGNYLVQSKLRGPERLDNYQDHKADRWAFSSEPQTTFLSQSIIHASETLSFTGLIRRWGILRTRRHEFFPFLGESLA